MFFCCTLRCTYFIWHLRTRTKMRSNSNKPSQRWHQQGPKTENLEYQNITFSSTKTDNLYFTLSSAAMLLVTCERHAQQYICIKMYNCHDSVHVTPTVRDKRVCPLKHFCFMLLLNSYSSFRSQFKMSLILSILTLILLGVVSNIIMW